MPLYDTNNFATTFDTYKGWTATMRDYVNQ